MASFAGNHKGMNTWGRNIEHGDIIGEYKAKLSTGTLCAEQVTESECLLWGRASCTGKAERSLENGKLVANQCAIAARHPSGKIIRQTTTASFGNLRSANARESNSPASRSQETLGDISLSIGARFLRTQKEGQTCVPKDIHPKYPLQRL